MMTPTYPLMRSAKLQAELSKLLTEYENYLTEVLAIVAEAYTRNPEAFSPERLSRLKAICTETGSIGFPEAHFVEAPSEPPAIKVGDCVRIKAGGQPEGRRFVVTEVRDFVGKLSANGPYGFFPLSMLEPALPLKGDYVCIKDSERGAGHHFFVTGVGTPGKAIGPDPLVYGTSSYGPIRASKLSVVEVHG